MGNKVAMLPLPGENGGVESTEGEERGEDGFRRSNSGYYDSNVNHHNQRRDYREMFRDCYEDETRTYEGATRHYDRTARMCSKGTAVAYATPLLLRVAESEDSFLLAGGTEQVALHGRLDATSLMTFHGRNGDQKNVKANREILITVKDGEIVTLYANTENGGRYLRPRTERRRRGLNWSGTSDDVLTESEAFEFIVRRSVKRRHSLTGEIVRRNAGSATMRPLSRMLSFRRARRSYYVPNRNSRGDDTLQDSSATLSDEEGDESELEIEDVQPVENVMDLLPEHEEDVIRHPSDNEDIVQVEEEGNNNIPLESSMREIPIVDDDEEYDDENDTDNNRDANQPEDEFDADLEKRKSLQQRQADIDRQQQLLLLRELKVGDLITLEYRSKPGYFLSADGVNGLIVLKRNNSNNNANLFEITAPELHHLVALNSNSSGTRMFAAREEEKEAAQLLEEERHWLELLQRLPLDCVYLVLQFKGNWQRAARLVCKDWCKAAEQHIRSVRINGEFEYCATNAERRRLTQFLARCKSLNRLTLRNIDGLVDENLSFIVNNQELTYVSLGGCRSLTDDMLQYVLQLRNVRDLNLASTKVTDYGLALIGETMESIERLNLYACTHITVIGVENVILSLPDLHSINIRGTNVELGFRDFSPVIVYVGPLSADAIYG